MQGIRDGRFDGFVVLGEWAVSQRCREEPADALGKHDECAERPRRGVGLHVGDITDPLLAVPLDADAGRVPRLAVGIGGGAVVHDAFGVDAGMQPVTAKGRAVVH